MFLDEGSGELAMRTQVNMQAEERVKVKIGQGPLGRIFSNATPLIIDAQSKAAAAEGGIKSIFQTKNLAIIPVSSSGKVIAVLGAGSNEEGFSFAEDKIELIGVFAKQVAVAVENDTLIRKTEELAVIDKLTGLYNENYIHGRLEEEIKRAISYQRPCSFVIFEVDRFEEYRRICGEIAAEKTLRKIAQTLKDNITDIDKASRFGDYQFAVLVPEKNKRQSTELAEKLMKKIEKDDLKQDRLKTSISLALSAGISATPIDGTTAAQLIDKSVSYLQKAKNGEQNKIVSS